MLTRKTANNGIKKYHNTNFIDFWKFEVYEQDYKG